MEVMGVFLGMSQPTRLKVFEEGCRRSARPWSAPHKRPTRSLRSDTLSHVTAWVCFSDSVIVTGGGGTLTAFGLPHCAARGARERIEQRLIS
jgi:hypothetical protein